MPRKATNALARQKTAKNIPVTLEIMENYLEPHFAALQEDSDAFRQEVDQRFVGVEGEIGGLKGEISGLKNEFGGLKNEFYRLSKTMNQRFDKQDSILEDIRTAFLTNQLEHREMKSQLRSHDQRIYKLEKQLA